MENNTSNSDHHKISPTAKITAYWRSLSDIPYSKEIAEAVEAEKTAVKMLGDRIKRMGSFSPAMFEVRYKSINYGLNKCGIDNVLELACGLSARGLEVIANGGVYVGTDIPEMHSESLPVITAIAKRNGLKLNNLYLQPANVLNEHELNDAASHFDGKKFAVCNEGLLPYLNMEEKAKMADNLRPLLLKNGGCWITTDLVFRVLREAIVGMVGNNAKQYIKTAMKNISNQTNRNLGGNDFTDKTEAIKFYEELGYSVEEFPLYANNYELSTYSRLRENFRDKFLEILSSASSYILRPRE